MPKMLGSTTWKPVCKSSMIETSNLFSIASRRSDLSQADCQNVWPDSQWESRATISSKQSLLASIYLHSNFSTLSSLSAFSQPRSRAWYLCLLHSFLSTKKPCMILMCLARLPHHSYLAFSEVCERLFDAACDPQEVDNRLNFFTKTVLSDFYSSLKSIWLAVGENNWQCKY